MPNNSNDANAINSAPERDLLCLRALFSILAQQAKTPGGGWFRSWPPKSPFASLAMNEIVRYARKDNPNLADPPYRSPHTLLESGLRLLMDQLSTTVAPEDRNEPPEALLEEYLMAGFSICSQDRPGLEALARQAPLDIWLAGFVPGAACQLTGFLLDIAGYRAHGLSGWVRRGLLLTLLAPTFRTWLRDEEPDLLSTQAAVARSVECFTRLGSRVTGERFNAADATMET